jgi:hypothetical protein
MNKALKSMTNHIAINSHIIEILSSLSKALFFHNFHAGKMRWPLKSKEIISERHISTNVKDTLLASSRWWMPVAVYKRTWERPAFLGECAVETMLYG